jgi:hypothetical protein
MAKPKPSPWIESGPSDAQRALQQARAALGTQADIARLRAKLGALPQAPASSSAAPVEGASASSLVVKLGGTLLLGVLGVAALQWAAPAGVPPAPRATAILATVPAATPAQPAPAAPPAAISTSTSDVPATPSAREPQRSARALTRGAAPTTAVAPLHAAAELELLMSAQDAVEQNPQRALALLDEHAHAYPQGNFVQERESLAIDALRKLGRQTQAAARAHAFVQGFPASPHAHRIAQWLAEHAHDTAPAANNRDGDHKIDALPLLTR